MATLPAQPQSIGKVLDAGFKLYTQSFKQAFFLAVIPSIVTALPYVIAGILPDTTAETDFSNPGVWVAIAIFAVAVIIINLAFYNAMIVRIWAIATNHDPGFGESVNQGLGFLFPVLWGAILYIVAIMIGMALLVIPGIILMLSLMLYTVIIVLKDERGIQAMKSSHGLVWGNWWRTAIIFSVPGIIAIILFSVASFGEVTLLLAVSDISLEDPNFETVFNLYYSLINIVLNGFIMPMYAAIMLANFNDLTLRKEGSDIGDRIDLAIQSA